ncbi:MAG: hypothetical protein LBP22_00395 [Deltaproteobacteria bacterium]|nr:hypothetical protein [Deltaproteobacteria bacterium]
MAEELWKKDEETLNYYKAAAQAVLEQAALNPDIGVPVDPDVAEFMGAFEDPCLTNEDWYNPGPAMTED